MLTGENTILLRDLTTMVELNRQELNRKKLVQERVKKGYTCHMVASKSSVGTLNWMYPRKGHFSTSDPACSTVT